MSKDAIIVGGGVIGCSIALRLAQAGLKVAVIERGRIGCEASRAAAGMLSPQSDALNRDAFFDLCLRSRTMYPAFSRELAELSGIDPEYRDEGTLFVALEERDDIDIAGWSSWQVERGLALEKLSSGALASREPAVTPQARGAVFIPNDHQVENRRLMDALYVAIKRAGVEVIEGQRVDALLTEGDRVTGIQCQGERLPAGAVLIAAGCWSGQLLQPLGLSLRTIPARGQMIALKGESLTLSATLHSSKCYLVPRRDGRLLIGATVEYVGFSKGTTAGGINYLLASALELVPGLENFEIAETWSGLRPDTPDHLPVVGATGLDNLYLATGHFRNGILLAPVTASAISEALTSGRMPADFEPFGLERFTSFEDAGSRDVAVARE